jgi:hypothetical protein
MLVLAWPCLQALMLLLCVDSTSVRSLKKERNINLKNIKFGYCKHFFFFFEIPNKLAAAVLDEFGLT